MKIKASIMGILSLCLWICVYTISSFPIFLLQRIWWIGAQKQDPHSALANIVTSEYRYAAQKALVFLLFQILTWILLRYKLSHKDAIFAFRKCFRVVLYAGIAGWLAAFAVPPFTAFAPLLLPLSTIWTLYHLIFRVILPVYQHAFKSTAQIIAGLAQRMPHPFLWVFVFSILFHSIALFKVALPINENSRDYLLTGDQPAYFYMADSLVRNQSLNVATNILPVSVYRREDGKHAGGPTRHNPHLRAGSAEYEARAKAFGDAMYSTHRPGTSILIAPFYAIGHLMGDYHRAWIAMFLIILVACAAREIAIIVQYLTSNTAMAMLFGMGGTMLLPVSVMSVAVYSETIMFFIVARLLRLAFENNLKWYRNLEISLWFSLSPWLQDKYGLWCLPFVIMRIIMLWPNWKAYILPALPFALSAFSMIKFNMLLYGRILPASDSLGSFLPLDDALRQGIPGIWLDWEYGLVMLAPVTLLLPAGIISINRALKSYHPNLVFRTMLLSSICTVVAATTIITGTWWCWWGGFAPPNRFMLPLVPVVTLTAALFTVQMRNRISIILWTMSIAMGIEAILKPGMWYLRVHPARFVTNTMWPDILKIRFPPFVPYYQTSGLQVPIMIALALFAVGYFVIILFNKNPVGKRCLIAMRLVFLICLLLLAYLSTAKYRNHKIEKTDIPFAIGYMQNTHLTYEPQSKELTLATDLYVHYFPGNFAMAVHYMASDGKSLLGQDDFDLNLYRRNVVYHDEKYLSAWREKGILKVRKIIAPPPPEAEYVRVRVYDPGGGNDYRPQARSAKQRFTLPQ